MKIKVSSFKKIDDVEVELSSVNVFIGANNSGKSSFIQGMQFSISACQTLKLLGTAWKSKKTKTAAIDSSEFLYTPTRDISYLYHGKRLTGSRTKDDRNWIEFSFDNGKKATLKISKGKNGGFTTMLQGMDLGEVLSQIEDPYCVYVPGIAGIPVVEKYEVPIAVKKSATRGDSNNYLRNILYAISIDQEKWDSFSHSVNKIYGGIDIKVSFDEYKSEYIDVYVTSGGVTLPLDSVGTGLLQIIQIFSYIEYFAPKIILLDEPDSHVHPTKQVMLANELVRRSKEDQELKIVFSTHSRYILEALEGEAKVFHFQSGVALEDVKGSNILLDIGAADADYLFAKKTLKYIVVTEDKVDNVSEKKDFLRKFLLANGLSEDEFVLHSYGGCTKVDFAKILEGFVRKQIPTAKVLLHIDRDQKLDDDYAILKLKKDCNDKDILFFLTRFQEIESYYCQPSHLSKVFDISLELASDTYERFVAELELETKRKLKNFVLRDRPDKGYNKDGQMDIKVVEDLVEGWYEKFKHELTPGKELLGKIKNHAQAVWKKDPNKILDLSDGLKCASFQGILPEGAEDHKLMIEREAEPA